MEIYPEAILLMILLSVKKQPLLEVEIILLGVVLFFNAIFWSTFFNTGMAFLILNCYPETGIYNRDSNCR